MKVTIEHKQKTIGTLRRQNLHGVEVHIRFSDEERAIIDQRQLKLTTVLERGHSADVSLNKAAKKESRGLGKRLLVAAVAGADANSTDLTINKLMKGPDLFWLTTPLEAKQYEEELKAQLVTLKDYITLNEGVEEQATSFEL